MNLVLEIALQWATRLVLLATGLLATAAVAGVALLAAAGWLLYAGWARLSGRPVTLRVAGLDPRALLARIWRGRTTPSPAAPAESTRTPRANANRGRVPRRRFDITDVQPRPPRA